MTQVTSIQSAVLQAPKHAPAHGDASQWARADAAAFAAVFRAQPAGVAVVTADAGRGPVALTATSVSSVSVDPALLVLSASDASSAAPEIVAAKTLVVHFLDADDAPLARLAATSGADRFGGDVSWERLPSGEPAYRGPARRVRARTVHRIRAGTATLLIAEALEVSGGSGASDASDASGTVGSSGAPGGAQRTGGPLVYVDRGWRTVRDSEVG